MHGNNAKPNQKCGFLRSARVPFKKKDGRNGRPFEQQRRGATYSE
jgi:hypothetical protein